VTWVVASDICDFSFQPTACVWSESVRKVLEVLSGYNNFDGASNGEERWFQIMSKL
jgi:hypothetical protein